MTLPGFPEVVDGSTAKPDGKVKSDTASDDKHKTELDQPSCKGNVAEHSVIEEQDR